MFKSEFIRCALLVMAIAILIGYKTQSADNPNGIVPFWSMVGKLSKTTTQNSTAQFNPTIKGDLWVINDGAGHGGDLTADRIHVAFLDIVDAYIDNLTSDQIISTDGTFTNLTSDEIIADYITSTDGTFTNLTSDEIIADYITATSGINTNALTVDHSLHGYVTVMHGINSDEITANTVNTGILNSTTINNSGTIYSATAEIVYIDGSTIECDLLNAGAVSGSGSASFTNSITTGAYFYGDITRATGYKGTSEIFVTGTQEIQVKGNRFDFKNLGVLRNGDTIEVWAPQGGGGSSFDPTQDFININEYLALREVSRDTIASPPTGEIRIFNDSILHIPVYKTNYGDIYSFTTQLQSIVSNYLLHFEGDFTDEKGNTWSGSGGIATSSSNKKFGNSSLRFAGTDDYLYTNNVTNFNFGAGDFTIDFWVRFDNTSSIQQALFAPQTDHDGIGVYLNYIGNKLKYFASSNGSSWDLSTGDNSSGEGSHTITYDTWYHIAWTRSGNTWRAFVNGEIDNTQTISGTVYSNTGYYSIGRWGGGIYYLQGYIDEFRIIKGTAVWTSDFIPPTSSYAR